jgi:hypothetical protein
MAESSPGPAPSPARFILLPALLTLGVTLARVVGELAHGPAWLFRREPVGWCLVSIDWLPLIFGPYFALRLRRAGSEPTHFIEARILFAVGLVVAAVGSPKVFAPNLRTQLVGNLLLALGAGLTFLQWRDFWFALVGYAYAARIPEAAVTFLALQGRWGTHYDLVPATYQGPQSLWGKFAMMGLLPDLVTWVAGTVLLGCLAGAVFMKEKGPRF